MTSIIIITTTIIDYYDCSYALIALIITLMVNIIITLLLLFVVIHQSGLDSMWHRRCKEWRSGNVIPRAEIGSDAWRIPRIWSRESERRRSWGMAQPIPEISELKNPCFRKWLENRVNTGVWQPKKNLEVKLGC